MLFSVFNFSDQQEKEEGSGSEKSDEESDDGEGNQEAEEPHFIIGGK